MGLLDDAIREHLELKRRRGADPAEVDRAEREALGPVRRQPEPLETAPFDEEAPVGADFDDAYGRAGERRDPYAEPPPDEPAEPYGAGPDDERAGGYAPFEAEEWDEEPRTAHHAAAEPEAPYFEDERFEEPPPRFEEPAPRFEEPPPRFEEPLPRGADDYLGQETVEHRLEPDELLESEEEPLPKEEPGAPEADQAEAPEDLDMLEETPDFLQDTPDHDRLWFEQRPPRDFDFDG